MEAILSEKRLWMSLRDKSAATWKRIENGVGPGTPDTVGTLYGHTAFVELKAGVGWGRDIVRPEQRIWLREWAAAGGACWLLVSNPGRCMLIPGHLVPYKHEVVEDKVRQQFWEDRAAITWDKVIWKELDDELFKFK
jgi:hypothetical protein